jgi:serine/threonine protein kinase
VFVHSKGIIHSDLAARQFLLNSARHVKLSDFGFSSFGDGDVLGFENPSHHLPRDIDGNMPSTFRYCTEGFGSRRCILSLLCIQRTSLRYVVKVARNAPVLALEERDSNRDSLLNNSNGSRMGRLVGKVCHHISARTVSVVSSPHDTGRQLKCRSRDKLQV